MSIKIHHGPPGSYKTSGAVADDFVPAVLAGRHIVTNVRGLESEQNVRDVLEGKGKTVPESFKLTYLDSTDVEKMEALRRFWHWAPDGVFFLIDEVQEVWPKAMRDSHLNKLNYPNGQEAANNDGKFLTIALAFEKHRHRNWDFIVTSPNINKVHAVVRGSAESAFKHKNLATLGKLFKGRYIEAYHAADTNGKPSDFYSVRKKAIPKYVFSLYKSTATGVVTDTTAGQSLFSDPKVLGLLLFIGVLIFAVFSAGTPKIFSNPDLQKLDSAVPDAAGAAVPQNRAGTLPPAANGSNPVGVRPTVPLPDRLAFLNTAEKIVITGSYTETDGNLIHHRFFLRVHFPDNRYFDLTRETAGKLGLLVVPLNQCYYELRSGAFLTYAFCEDLPLEAPEDSPFDSTASPALAFDASASTSK